MEDHVVLVPVITVDIRENLEHFQPTINGIMPGSGICLHFFSVLIVLIVTWGPDLVIPPIALVSLNTFKVIKLLLQEKPKNLKVREVTWWVRPNYPANPTSLDNNT